MGASLRLFDLTISKAHLGHYSLVSWHMDISKLSQSKHFGSTSRGHYVLLRLHVVMRLWVEQCRHVDGKSAVWWHEILAQRRQSLAPTILRPCLIAFWLLWKSVLRQRIEDSQSNALDLELRRLWRNLAASWNRLKAYRNSILAQV